VSRQLPLAAPVAAPPRTNFLALSIPRKFRKFRKFT
jgi:hypothetical protein